MENFDEIITQDELGSERLIEFRRKMAERRLQRFLNDGEPQGKVSKSQQFLPISFELLDNPEFRNRFMNKKRFRTYLWLRRHVVRGMKHKDPASLYLNYRMKGELAVSVSLNDLAENLNLAKSTVSDHIKQLERDGLLEIEVIGASESDDGQLHHVYVLGNSHCDNETWLIDDVFKVSGRLVGDERSSSNQ